MNKNIDIKYIFAYHGEKGGVKMQKLLVRERRYKFETQSDIADLIGVKLRTYQNKEAGISQFKQDEMFKIAKHFNKRIDEIFLPTNFMNHEVE